MTTENDDDLALFRTEMKGVKPIKYDKADTGKKPIDKTHTKILQRHASNSLAKETVVDGLSDQFVIDVQPEAILYWAKNGIQENQMRRLKTGQTSFEGSVDLHGYTINQARSLIWELIEEATKREVRCIHITHGKAQRKDNSKATLKSYVNTWLRQHPQVLGFCSCLPKHGGTGALYVLLKRTLLDGRDEV